MAIKADILRNLADPDISASAVALRQGITPRYIHMLFESEGTTFSTFVLNRRLILAYRMLSDPYCSSLTVTRIAFEVGFGDLSYFDRTFRRRFGKTPSELRRSEKLANSDKPDLFAARAPTISKHFLLRPEV
jgi:AraC-like DNA-binding protein